MSQSSRPYISALRSSLNASLCLQHFASQIVERHIKPEVEIQTSSEVILNPILVARNENEYTLIETSINSVRVSMKLKQSDDIEKILNKSFTRFLMMRAEEFSVLRRKAVPGYDLSLLITVYHCTEMIRVKLVEFVCIFLEEIDKEMSEMKLCLNARARVVADTFLSQFQ
eukprot:NODE_305_length_11349_cov_0.358222.p8 type:complete len:170 gc:universal NODE_305_length_11349_cov_0.358222:11172-10663(-)